MPSIEVGDFSYNGVTFGASSKITVESSKVRDEANRTPVCHRYEFRVEAIVSADAANTTDGDLERLRELLSEDGRPLIFKDKGFGEMRVNAGGALKDVMFGPKSEVLTWEPLGSVNACRVVWTCVTHIPECQTRGIMRTTGLMALNYSIDYRYDHRGNLTRTYSGYIQIVGHRAGHHVADTADAYREHFNPAVPEGYARIVNEWNLAADNARIDFTIADQQIASPNAFPPGIAKIEAKQRQVWSTGYEDGGAIATELSCSMERLHGVPGAMAHLIFLSMVDARKKLAESAGKVPMLESVSIQEDIFGYSSDFSARWRVIGSLADILTDFGLWSPLGYTWGAWKESMATSMFSHTGNSGIRRLPGQDTIIDLCCECAAPVGSDGTPPYEPRSPMNGYTNGRPPAEKSWMRYDARLRVDADRPLSRQAALQDDDQEQEETDPHASKPPTWLQTIAGIRDKIQVGGRARFAAAFYGAAIRVGHFPPKPRLVKVGALTAHKLKERVVTWQMGDMLGVPVIASRWDIRYLLEGPPGAVPPPYILAEASAMPTDGSTPSTEGPIGLGPGQLPPVFPVLPLIP